MDRTGVLAPFIGQLTVYDQTGYDIGPLVEAAAKEHGVPVVGLLALLEAESGLDPYAARYGVWPDVSFGYCQMTVATARYYGIGDGSVSQENIATVREALFDRATAIDVGAEHYGGNLAFVKAKRPQLAGDDWLLMGLRVYNGGAWGLTDEYAARYPGHIAAYRDAIAWAKRLAGN